MLLCRRQEINYIFSEPTPVWLFFLEHKKNDFYLARECEANYEHFDFAIFFRWFPETASISFPSTHVTITLDRSEAENRFYFHSISSVIFIHSSLARDFSLHFGKAATSKRKIICSGDRSRARLVDSEEKTVFSFSSTFADATSKSV